MYLKKYINFNIFKFNFSISQHVVCLHLFDLFTYLISLHWKIESEIAWIMMNIIMIIGYGDHDVRKNIPYLM